MKEKKNKRGDLLEYSNVYMTRERKKHVDIANGHKAAFRIYNIPPLYLNHIPSALSQLLSW